MRNKVIALVVILLVAGAAAAYKLYDRQTTGITATGTIEVTRVDVTPKLAGYLSQLNAREGDSVNVGQVIARVDRKDLEAQLLRDELAAEKAKIQLSEYENGSRAQELQEAAAKLAAAQAEYDKNRTDLERYQTLAKEGAIAVQQLDNTRASYDVARNSLLAAQARYSLLAEGTRSEVVAAQRREVERSQAVVAASRTLTDDMIIQSPAAGLVISKNYERGEFVNAGSAILTIGVMDDCWVKIYVPSTQLGLIKIGQPAKVKVDSFPDREFDGVIIEISQTAEYTPRQSLTQRERANMVFAVKVKLDNAQGVLKPGMPADVTLP